MKTTTTLAFLFALLSFSAVKATNYYNNGTYAVYSLKSGDTLRIVQGTFNGTISNLPGGAVIIVAQPATFAPAVINFWTPAGKIINNGTIKLTTMGIGGGFNIENNSTATVNGDMNFYNGAPKTLTNNTGATFTVKGTLTASNNTTILNKGTLNTTGAIHLYAANASLTNSGIINVGANFNSEGRIVNENVIRMAGDFNYWGGQLNNTGAIVPAGTFAISKGITYVNSCRLITKGGIENNGTLQNNGLVWAGTSNTAADQLINSGTIINAGGAKVRTATFTNYGRISGSGFYYATGHTTLGGGATIGVPGVTTDSIKVYDATRTNATGIFDNQWGTVRPNVKYAAFAAPDSFEIYPGCSASFKASAISILPVTWNYFYVKAIKQQPVVYWSAVYEAGMTFEIERSYNGLRFTTLKTVDADNSAAYTFTDAAANTAQSVVYYRIKGISAADGDVKYTETRSVRLDEKQANAVSVSPNPAVGHIVVNYTARTEGPVMIRIKAANGQTVLFKNVATAAGFNRFALSETAQLVPGLYFVDLIKGNEIVGAEKVIKQ